MKNYINKNTRLFLNFIEKRYSLENSSLFFVYEILIFLLHFKFFKLNLFSRREGTLFYIFSDDGTKFYFFNRNRVRRYISCGSLDLFCNRLF